MPKIRGLHRLFLSIALASAAANSSLAAADAEALPEVAEHLAVVRAAQEAALRDARSDAERSLIKADLDFAADAQRMHVAEAFAARVAPDAVLIGPGDPVVLGAEAIRADMLRSKASWYWSPIEARANGDLGVTWGVAAIVYRNKEGRQASIQTRYVTAWQLRDGQWKIWLDTGNAGPATAALVQDRLSMQASAAR